MHGVFESLCYQRYVVTIVSQEAFIASFEDAYTVQQVHQDGHRIVIFKLTPLRQPAAEV
jgi:hypothetical protein